MKLAHWHNGDVGWLIFTRNVYLLNDGVSNAPSLLWFVHVGFTLVSLHCSPVCRFV